MAQKLFEADRFLTKENQSIFTSDKDQIVFLEIWNESEEEVPLFISVGEKIYQDSKIVVCDEENYAHQFHQIAIKKGEDITALAGKENAISYNIII